NMIGIIILGGTRTLMAKKQYEQVRFGVSLAGLTLPAYDTVKDHLTCLKGLLGLKLVNWISPLDNECYVMQIDVLVGLELAKPDLVQHLKFYAELRLNGMVE
ncbi:hypothetical protein CROQUDRAFT_27304, partial [Cronartium quercuum f. sp. fusiforme G11]